MNSVYQDTISLVIPSMRSNSFISPEGDAFLVGIITFIGVIFVLFVIQINKPAPVRKALKQKIVNTELRQVSAVAAPTKRKIRVEISSADGYVPSAISLQKNEEVQLIFTKVASTEAHGVFFPSLDEKSFVMQEADKEKTVDLGPFDSVGTYEFMESMYDAEKGELPDIHGVVVVRE